MAGVKISALPASPGLSGSELVPVVDGGVTMRTTVGAIAALGGGGITLPIQTDGDTVLFELRDSGTPTRTLDVGVLTDAGDNCVSWVMSDDLGGQFRFGPCDDEGGSVFSVNNMSTIRLDTEQFLLLVGGNQGIVVEDNLGTVEIGFFGLPEVPQPIVPAVPTAQDIVDALVALGLVSQSP